MREVDPWRFAGRFIRNKWHPAEPSRIIALARQRRQVQTDA